MKENLFRYLTKRACLLGLVAASVIGTSLTLTSCGGGDENEGGYVVTAQQFASGSKLFYIEANNLRTLHATGSSGLITSGPDNYTGTVTAWGEITTGSYDKENAGIAVVLFHYHYNKETNIGTLEWSWDSADPENAPPPALAYITTVHNLPSGGGGDDDDGGDDGEMGGIGEEDAPTALAEHYRQPRLEFNFNTGQCVMYCGCGPNMAQLKLDNVRYDSIDSAQDCHWTIAGELIFADANTVVFTGTETLQDNGAGNFQLDYTFTMGN